MKRMVALVLVCTLFTVLMSGCGLVDSVFKPSGTTTEETTESVEALIDRCVAACNELDLEGILDCVTPKIADPVRAMLKVAGSLGGKSEEELIELLASMLGAEESTDAWAICTTLEATVDSLEVRDDQAEAKVSFHYVYDGEKFVGKTNVSCVRVDGKWYISKLSA